MTRLFAIIFCLTLLAGCGAIRDHGAVDYRRAEIAPVASNTDGVVQPGEHHLYADLRRMNESDASGAYGISEDDSITIRLGHAYFEDFPELPFAPSRIFSDQSVFTRRGEIAILINAFEYIEESTDETRLDWTPNSFEDAHVIYYSDDVENNQHANFNNMPIYGPVEYNGGPIAIDIFMIEIDQVSPQFQSILKTLAEQGARLGGPSAEALSILNSLGTSLLSGNQDDIFFRYTLILDPGQNNTYLPIPRIEEGRYAFIRQQNRDTSVNWPVLSVDHNTGVLYWLPSSYVRGRQPIESTDDDIPCDCERRDNYEYADSTYITLTVSGGESTNVDLGLRPFSQLRQAIRDDAAKNEASIAGILEEVVAAVSRELGERNFDRHRNLWAQTERAALGWARIRAANQSSTEATADSVSDAEVVEAQRAFAENALEFHQSFVNVLGERDATNDDDKKDALMSQQDINRLMVRIRRLLVVDPALTAGVNQSSFESSGSYNTFDGFYRAIERGACTRIALAGADRCNLPTTP